MEAILLPIIGLLITITLMILFYTKSHIKNVETNIYSKLLVLSFIFILIGIITYIVAKTTNNLFLVKIFQKIYMSILILLNYYSIDYCDKIFNKNKLNNNWILIGITIISILLVFILPLDVIFYDNVLDGIGLSYNIAIIYCILSFIFFIIISIKLLIDRKKIIKVMPFIILILLYVVGFILRNIYSELIFEGFFYSYILLIMYNTIENPDVKIIKELEFNKMLLEKENNVIKKGFNDLAIKFKEPLDELAKIDDENAKSLVDKIHLLIDITRIENNILDNNHNYYKTEDLFDNLKDIINSKDILVKYNISKNIPITLYGNINQVKQINIYLINYINKYLNIKEIELSVDSINVGNICKLRFSYKIIMLDKEYRMDTDSIEYLIYKKILEKNDCKYNVEIDDNIIKFNFQIYNKINNKYIEDKVDNDISIDYIDLSDKRVLIFDDNRKNCNKLISMLNLYKINTDIAVNIEELVSLIDSNKTYDLILYSEVINTIKDYVITDDNAFQIERKLKLISGYKIPIVVLGNKKYKTIDYIIKPVDNKELNDILIKYLFK